MKHFIRNLAFAAVAAVGLGTAAVQAAPVHSGTGNIYSGTIPGANALGPLDLANGAFVFSGITGGASGGLTVDLFNSALGQSATGALQILIQALAGDTITFGTLTFDGNALTLSPVTGGYAASISGNLPAQFVLSFSNANFGDSIQVTIAAVPLPAGGLLLLGGLGALAAFRRRKAAA